MFTSAAINCSIERRSGIIAIHLGGGGGGGGEATQEVV